MKQKTTDTTLHALLNAAAPATLGALLSDLQRGICTPQAEALATAIRQKLAEPRQAEADAMAPDKEQLAKLTAEEI